MLILVINCGSSSVKYQVFNIEKRKVLVKGSIDRIGQDGSVLKHVKDGTAISRKVDCPDHYFAISIIGKALTDRRHGVIKSVSEIAGIGHRVVHGGEEFKSSTLITPEVKRSIERFSELAPLHNPPALSGIRACSMILKNIPQVAVFDTSFHQTMPAKSFLYGLPMRFYRKYGIRKYGFHGTSHRFVAEQAARVLGRAANSLKLITCHLGNGCSMAAVDGGESVDTTMGFTPLEGLLMGTRSGDMDPAVVFYLMDKELLSPERISNILNKESGLLGISGVSNDMRDLLKASRGAGGAARSAALAVEMFVYRIERYIGAYMAAMGGLDAVIFTAGIGENNPWLVRRIARDLKAVVPKNAKFIVIPTNEEFLIARDTYTLIKEKGKRTNAKS